METHITINEWKDNPEWLDKIDVEEYKKLAAVGYTPVQIAMYYGISSRDFLWYFHLLGSPLKYNYDQGQLQLQAKESLKMIESATKGNTTQSQRLDKLRNELEFKNNISKVFFDDIG